MEAMLTLTANLLKCSFNIVFLKTHNSLSLLVVLI